MNLLDKKVLRKTGLLFVFVALLLSSLRGTSQQVEVFTGKDPFLSAPVLLTKSQTLKGTHADKKQVEAVLVYVDLIVDKDGHPQDPRVGFSNAPSFNQRALELVKQYRFKPAMRFEKPVPVRIRVEVRLDRTN